MDAVKRNIERIPTIKEDDERDRLYQELENQFTNLGVNNLQLSKESVINFATIIKKDAESNNESLNDTAMKTIESILNLNMLEEDAECVFIRLLLQGEAKQNLKSLAFSVFKSRILVMIQSGAFNPNKMFGDEDSFPLVKAAIYEIGSELLTDTCIKFLLSKVIPCMFGKHILPAVRDRAIEVGLDLMTFVNISHVPPREQSGIVFLMGENYIKIIGELRDENYPNWHKLWIFLVRFYDVKMHSMSSFANKLLRVVEMAFRNSSSMEQRLQAYDCWEVLINNWSLDLQYMCTPKQFKLLITPIKAKFSRMPLILVKRFEMFLLLLQKLQDKSTLCLKDFLEFCYGPFNDKSNLDKTKQGKSVTEVCARSTKVLMSIIGHRHGEKNNCLKDDEVKFHKPVINCKNFSEYGPYIVNSIIECSQLVDSWCADDDEHETVIQCLWNSVLHLISQTDLETARKCQVHIRNFLLTLPEKLDEDRNYVNVAAIIINILIMNLKLFHIQMYEPLFNLVLNIAYRTENGKCPLDFKSSQNFIINCLKNENISVQVNKIFLSYYNRNTKWTNFEFMCEMWMLYDSYINDTFMKWPIRYLEYFKDQKTFEEKWLKLYHVQFKSDENKIELLRDIEKLFRENPLLSNKIVIVMELIYICEKNPRKEFVFKFITLLELVLSLPNLPDLNVNKLKSIILGYFEENQLFNQLESTEETMSKYINCIEQIMVIHKEFSLLSMLETFSKQIQKKYFVKFSKRLIKFLENLMINENEDVMSNARKIIEILEIREHNNSEETTFATPSTPRSLRIVNMASKKPKESPKTSEINSLKLFGKNIETLSPLYVKGSQLSKNLSKRSSIIFGNTLQEKKGQPLVLQDDKSSDYVKIDTQVTFQPDKLNEHQKEVLKKRREDIPALYQDLSQSHSESYDISSDKTENSSNLEDKTTIDTNNGSVKNNKDEEQDPVKVKNNVESDDSDNEYIDWIFSKTKPLKSYGRLKPTTVEKSINKMKKSDESELINTLSFTTSNNPPSGKSNNDNIVDQISTELFTENVINPEIGDKKEIISKQTKEERITPDTSIETIETENKDLIGNYGTPEKRKRGRRPKTLTNVTVSRIGDERETIFTRSLNETPEKVKETIETENEDLVNSSGSPGKRKRGRPKVVTNVINPGMGDEKETRVLEQVTTPEKVKETEDEDSGNSSGSPEKRKRGRPKVVKNIISPGMGEEKEARVLEEIISPEKVATDNDLISNYGTPVKRKCGRPRSLTNVKEINIINSGLGDEKEARILEAITTPEKTKQTIKTDDTDLISNYGSPEKRKRGRPKVVTNVREENVVNRGMGDEKETRVLEEVTTPEKVKETIETENEDSVNSCSTPEKRKRGRQKAVINEMENNVTGMDDEKATSRTLEKIVTPEKVELETMEPEPEKRKPGRPKVEVPKRSPRKPRKKEYNSKLNLRFTRRQLSLSTDSSPIPSNQKTELKNDDKNKQIDTNIVEETVKSIKVESPEITVALPEIGPPILENETKSQILSSGIQQVEIPILEPEISDLEKREILKIRFVRKSMTDDQNNSLTEVSSSSTTDLDTSTSTIIIPTKKKRIRRTGLELMVNDLKEAKTISLDDCSLEKFITTPQDHTPLTTDPKQTEISDGRRTPVGTQSSPRKLIEVKSPRRIFKTNQSIAKNLTESNEEQKTLTAPKKSTDNKEGRRTPVDPQKASKNSYDIDGRKTILTQSLTESNEKQKSLVTPKKSTDIKDGRRTPGSTQKISKNWSDIDRQKSAILKESTSKDLTETDEKQKTVVTQKKSSDSKDGRRTPVGKQKTKNSSDVDGRKTPNLKQSISKDLREGKALAVPQNKSTDSMDGRRTPVGTQKTAKNSYYIDGRKTPVLVQSTSKDMTDSDGSKSFAVTESSDRSKISNSSEGRNTPIKAILSPQKSIIIREGRKAPLLVEKNFNSKEGGTTPVLIQSMSKDITETSDGRETLNITPVVPKKSSEKKDLRKIPINKLIEEWTDAELKRRLVERHTQEIIDMVSSDTKSSKRNRRKSEGIVKKSDQVKRKRRSVDDDLLTTPASKRRRRNKTEISITEEKQQNKPEIATIASVETRVDPKNTTHKEPEIPKYRKRKIAVENIKNTSIPSSDIIPKGDHKSPDNSDLTKPLNRKKRSKSTSSAEDQVKKIYRKRVKSVDEPMKFVFEVVPPDSSSDHQQIEKKDSQNSQVEASNNLLEIANETSPIQSQQTTTTTEINTLESAINNELLPKDPEPKKRKSRELMGLSYEFAGDLVNEFSESQDIIESSQKSSLRSPRLKGRPRDSVAITKRKMKNLSKLDKESFGDSIDNQLNSNQSGASNESLTETETCGSDITIYTPQIQVQLPIKPTLTDSETQMSLASTLTKSDSSLSSTQTQQETENFDTSPVTCETPDRNLQLLNDTSDVSPIGSNDKIEQEVKIPSKDIAIVKGARASKLLQMVNNYTPVMARRKTTNINSTSKSEPKKKKDENIDVLEFSRDLPSPLTVPGSSILKSKRNNLEESRRVLKRKRVNFSDPAVTEKKIVIKDPDEFGTWRQINNSLFDDEEEPNVEEDLAYIMNTFVEKGIPGEELGRHLSALDKDRIKLFNRVFMENSSTENFNGICDLICNFLSSKKEIDTCALPSEKREKILQEFVPLLVQNSSEKEEGILDNQMIENLRNDNVEIAQEQSAQNETKCDEKVLTKNLVINQIKDWKTEDVIELLKEVADEIWKRKPS